MGYPYVWGGSSPSTSFDCSGFVSYVLTNSGLCNTGRLGAQGLYNISTPVSDPQPGDLVFFVGTYDTSGVSHVGIYVGDGMMLHCGDPIQYSNLNTSYWLENFDLSHVPVYMMGEEQLSLYATYMSTLGNRPDLFPSSGYVNKYIDNPPAAWEIPAEYLTDERFNTLITEAEKYLGLSLCMGRQQPQHLF